MITNRIHKARIELNNQLEQRKLLIQNIKQEKQNLKESTSTFRNATEAQRILQEVAKQVQEQAHDRIASLVTRCLALVFPDPYKLEILFEKKANRTEAVLVLTRNGKQFDPTDSTGGGVLDVVSFALRLSCLYLQMPKPREIVIMDEPFKYLSTNLRPRVASMLEMLSEELEFQFIISTHSKALKLGTVIELE